VVWPADQAACVADDETNLLPRFVASDAVAESAPQKWHGKANRLSRDDPVRWQILDQVEVACWKSSIERRVVEWKRRRPTVETPVVSSRDVPSVDPRHSSAGQVIRQRRGALAFDGVTSIPVGSFYAMLARVVPRVDRDYCQRPVPWDVLPWEPAVHLALFVHRVDGLAPGIYLLARDPAKTNRIRGAMRRQFAWTAPPGCPPPFVMISWATAMAAHTLTNPGDRRGRCSGRRSNLQFRIDNRCHCSAHPSLRIRSLKRRPRQPAR
jgi:hypothetical protein